MRKFAYLIVGVLIFMTSHVAMAAPFDVFTVSVDCNQITITWDNTSGLGIETTLLLQVDGNMLINQGNLPIADSRQHIFVPALQDGAFVATMITDDKGNFGEWRGKVFCDVPASMSEVVLCNDGRVNINLCEPLAIYPVVSADGVALSSYEIDRADDEGEFAFDITAWELSNLPDLEAPCTLAFSADGQAVAYLIPRDAGPLLQINYGPDEEGKFFEYSFYNGFPSVPTIETFWGLDGVPLPVLAPCFDSES